MAVTYKDISLLTQKATIAGTEKIPISATNYITPSQIVPAISTNIVSDASSDTKTASPKAVKTYVDGIVGDIETLLAAL